MRRVQEIYWLRAYGCIAVFLFHLLDHVNQRLDNVVTDLMRLPLVLGTSCTALFIRRRNGCANGPPKSR